MLGSRKCGLYQLIWFRSIASLIQALTGNRQDIDIAIIVSLHTMRMDTLTNFAIMIEIVRGSSAESLML